MKATMPYEVREITTGKTIALFSYLCDAVQLVMNTHTAFTQETRFEIFWRNTDRTPWYKEVATA